MGSISKISTTSTTTTTTKTTKSIPVLTEISNDPSLTNTTNNPLKFFLNSNDDDDDDDEGEDGENLIRRSESEHQTKDTQKNDPQKIFKHPKDQEIEPKRPSEDSWKRLESFIDYQDQIYGKFRIDSSCAIEIMELEEFRRLRRVLQHGITALIGCLPSPSINRFEHSVGAMILVKVAGGSEEAQLAALLHDVAHTAFSHVADYVFDYVVHEVDKTEYLESTEIPKVLRKYGFDPERVFNEELFPLLELPSPDICADRLDYSLRDSVSFKLMRPEDSLKIFRSMVTIDGRMVLDSIESASVLSDSYLSSDQEVWANPTESYIYRLTARVLKEGLRLGLIDRSTLWKLGDEEVWEILKERGTPKMKKLIGQINKDLRIQEIDPDDFERRFKGKKIFEIDCPELFEEEEDDDVNDRGKNDEGEGRFKLVRMRLKLRTIDPLIKLKIQNTVDEIQGDGKFELKRLSEVDQEYFNRRKDYLESRSKPIVFKVFSF